MAGALFVVSLPTICYETANRPIVTEANQETKAYVINENAKNQSNLKISDLLEPKISADVDSEVNLNTDNYDIYKSVDRMDNKRNLDPITRKKGVLSGHSVSTPAIQNVDQSFVNDIAGDKKKIHTISRSVSASNSTEVLIEEFPGNMNKTNKESDKSIVNTIGKKIVSALTSTKGAPTSDAVSTPEPDTNVPLETSLLGVLENLGIEGAVWNTEKNGKFYQVYFSVESGEQCEECLEYLHECGFGLRPNTTVSVLPCDLYYKGGKEVKDKLIDETEKGENTLVSSQIGINGDDDSTCKVWDWNKFVASVRARLTVAQVVASVRANAELTFDFIMLLLVAGMVAAMGLVENSSVVLVASMLISPLMGPILAGTFGIVIQDRQLQKIGVLNELLGLALCIIVGFLFGLIVGCSSDHWGYADASQWPTSEMVSRGVMRSLWVGVLIALPSGAGVALSVLGGNAASLVGVAISASLLPPAVNAGLLWALAVIKAISYSSEHQNERIWVYSTSEAEEYAMLGAVSLCLTLVNIACIFVAAVIVLKVKEVAPQSNRDGLRRFWKHDIKIARDYYRTMHGDDATDLGKRLLKELAVIPVDQRKALVEEAERSGRSFRRHISESGVPGNKESIISFGPSNNQLTWTPGTNACYQRPGFEFRRKSVTLPSDEEAENLVYSTLNAGSKLGLFRSMGRQGASGHPGYRKISSSSLPGNGHGQIRSPKRSTVIEHHLGTITESSSSLLPALDILHTPQNSPVTRFQVTPCVEDNSIPVKSPRKCSKAPLAKTDEI